MGWMCSFVWEAKKYIHAFCLEFLEKCSVEGAKGDERKACHWNGFDLRIVGCEYGSVRAGWGMCPAASGVSDVKLSGSTIE
jgi:hypothetical protein